MQIARRTYFIAFYILLGEIFHNGGKAINEGVLRAEVSPTSLEYENSIRGSI